MYKDKLRMSLLQKYSWGCLWQLAIDGVWVQPYMKDLVKIQCWIKAEAMSDQLLSSCKGLATLAWQALADARPASTNPC